MPSLSVCSPMASRTARPILLAAALAATVASGCAEGDAIENPSGTSSGPGGGDGSGGSGGAPASTTGTDVGSSSSSSTATTASGPGGGPSSTTTTSSSGGGEGGAGTTGAGGDGGAGTTTGGGEGGGGGSPPEPFCGDGVRNGAEACDGADLNDETCVSLGQGFTGGTLGCDDTCAFDTSGCTTPPACGDGDIEGTEQCDGANLGGATCQTRGFQSGTLSCTGGCVLDESACWTCGDAAISGDELCDGAALGGTDCVDLGHDGGTLACGADCHSFVQTACSDCGDNQVEAPEACDGGNFAGATCASMGFTGGTLICNGTCSSVSTANCYTCGDGTVQGAEVCDGANLDGQSCVGLGYDGGTLGCNAGCLGFNVSQCFDSQCNDGLDNDNDGFVDFGSDLGCTSANDASEVVYADECNGNGSPIFDTGYPLFSVSYAQPFDTTGFPDNSDAACQGNTGPEIWFVYRNEQFQDDIWIYTQPTGDPGEMTDTVITVHRGTCTAPALCDDDAGDGLHARVIVDAVQPGELLFVKVEGFSSQVGYGELVFDLFYNEQ